MMKIFSTTQIRAWDHYTIENEPITSVELMNRAAAALVENLLKKYPGRKFRFICGTGNNGGDGLAAARILFEKGIHCAVWICNFSGKSSPDFEAQRKILPSGVSCTELHNAENLPVTDTETILVDGLFGSGLTRPPEGEWARMIEWINAQPNPVFAIDLPSGLFADEHTTGICVKADHTFSFETPKRAFFFPENAGYVGDWESGSIGLHPAYAAHTETPFYYLIRQAAKSLLRPRNKFDHKGTFGHSLLICGSFGKMGAALLAARACLRSGAGLLTVHAPLCGHDVLQSGIPEAMYSADSDHHHWTQLPTTAAYRAIGVGCGIGTDPKTAAALEMLFRHAEHPLVIDADALNLLAQHPEWWPLIPENSILTPHPKEFERLFGKTANDFERNDLQRVMAQKYQVVLILKGAHTAIALPNGDCWFNSTGNPGMATGGSGDVLTGILTGLLAQGYTPEDAARLGVYLHGLAGDLAAARQGMVSMVAGDLVEALGAAFRQFES